MENDNQSIRAICYVCEKEFKSHGLVGGNAVCGKCYPIWFKGVMDERKDWEKWTGKTYLQMYHLYEKQDNKI